MKKTFSTPVLIIVLYILVYIIFAFLISVFAQGCTTTKVPTSDLNQAQVMTVSWDTDSDSVHLEKFINQQWKIVFSDTNVGSKVLNYKQGYYRLMVFKDMTVKSSEVINFY